MPSFFRIRTIVAAVAVLTALLNGCTGDPGPQGPAGPSLQGSLGGRVVLYDEWGAEVADQSGVTVFLNGRADTVLTDSTGRWTIRGVPTGIYTVIIWKSGYGSTEIPLVQFVGGGDLILGTRVLAEDPSFVTEGIGTIYSSPAQTLRFDGSVSNTSPSDRSVVIFVGRRPIDLLDPSTYIDTLVAAVYANSSVYNSTAIRLHEPPYNFAPGDTIHAVSASVSRILDGYVDPWTGRTVFTTGITEFISRHDIISP